MSRNLAVRVGFAVPAIGVAVLVLWLGGWWLAATLAVLGTLGAREVYQLARRTGVEPLNGAGYLSAAAIPLATLAGARHDGVWIVGVPYAVVLWLLALLAIATFARGPGRRPLSAVAITFVGALYASAPLAFLIPMRHGGNSEREPGAYFLLALLPLVLTWICDTAAFGTGTVVGGPKLAPGLSPRKTWSGALGGLVATLGFAVALGMLVLNRAGWRLGVWHLVGVGLVVGVLGQLGDLAESLVKREADVKDSSALLPGHGGVLDRLDSLYFVIPAAAALFKLYGVI